MAYVAVGNCFCWRRVEAGENEICFNAIYRHYSSLN